MILSNEFLKRLADGDLAEVPLHQVVPALAEELLARRFALGPSIVQKDIRELLQRVDK